MNQARYIDTPDVAKLVRAELHQAYPFVRFSVKSRRYAGGSSIDVRWTDGPAAKVIENLVGHFHGKSFDGMTDSSSYHDSRTPSGELVHYGNGYIFCQREISHALWYAVGMDVARENRLELTEAEQEQLAIGRAPNRSIPGRDHYFQEAIYRALGRRGVLAE